MLLKNKIIMITVFCLIISLDISVVYYARNCEKTVIKNEYSAAEREQGFIYNDIVRILNNSAARGFDNINLSENTVYAYSAFYEKYGVGLKLQNHGENTDICANLSIVSQLPKPYNDKDLVYTKSLDSVRQLKKQWRDIFMVINFCFIPAAAVLVSIMTGRTMLPLDELTEKIKWVANGNYNTKLDVKRSDETGVIAEEFNKMAAAVKDNIGKLNIEIGRREEIAENLAHELKNPLTVIGGFAEYMLKGNITDDERTKACIYIINEAQRLNFLCEKTLELMLKGENTDEILKSLSDPQVREWRKRKEDNIQEVT